MEEQSKAAGRRTKLTPEVQKRILSAIRAGNYATVAAEYAGIRERTFYAWLQRGRGQDAGIYRDFLEAVKSAEREAEVRAVAHIQSHMAGSWQAAMTYLERKFPERWAKRERVSISLDPKETLSRLFDVPTEELSGLVESATNE